MPDSISPLRSTYWNPVREYGRTCRVCTAPTRDGFPICWNCREHSRAPYPTADIVAPLTYAVKGEQSYRDLAVYKDARYPIESRSGARSRVLGLVYAALSNHLSCIEALTSSTVVLASVPSTSGERPGPHPLADVLGMFDDETPRLGLSYVGEFGLERNQRREFTPSNFRVVSPEAALDSHVILFDDSWVRGGHLQSAASAARLAGASWVTAIPIGRVLDSGYPDTRAFLVERQDHSFDPEVCPLTGMSHS